jgi:hypothetical protein
MVITVMIIYILLNIFMSLILFFVFLFSFGILGIYMIFVIKERTDFPNDKELKELLEFLDRKDVIEYIRELVCDKLINKYYQIGIELDSKFHTNLTQKKGFTAGRIRDKLLAIKIEKLYFKIINDNKNK